MNFESGYTFDIFADTFISEIHYFHQQPEDAPPLISNVREHSRKYWQDARILRKFLSLNGSQSLFSCLEKRATGT